MNQRRTVMVIAAIAIGAVAALGVFVYASGAQERAYKSAELVNVIQIKTPIPKGTPGQDAIEKGWVGTGRIPRTYRPGTAITSVDQLKGKVAIIDLAAGQVLVDGAFVLPSQANTGLGGAIPTGQVAVTVSLDSVRAVGGNLTPDSIVDITTADEGRRNADGSDATKEDDTIRVLYQNVRILAIGTNVAAAQGAQADPNAAAAANTGLITFAVPAIAAERIVKASQSEFGLYLFLVPKANVPTPIEPIGNSRLFPPIEELTPYPS